MINRTKGEYLEAIETIVNRVRFNAVRRDAICRVIAEQDACQDVLCSDCPFNSAVTAKESHAAIEEARIKLMEEG